MPTATIEGPIRLRRPTLATAPFLILGVMAATVLVSVGLWGVWHPEHLGTGFWVAVSASAVIAGLAAAGSAGCFIEVSDERVRDVVGWFTVSRVHRPSIRTVRVRAGVWRWFELELDDGSLRTLVGASPMQFPARLLPGSVERDLGDLDLLLGEDTA